MTLDRDCEEPVYARVLGKIIGVYLGRPLEGCTYEQAQGRFGDVSGYLHDELRQPLVVTDDDISGTFALLRALPDHGNRLNALPGQLAGEQAVSTGNVPRAHLGVPAQRCSGLRTNVEPGTANGGSSQTEPDVELAHGCLRGEMGGLAIAGSLLKYERQSYAAT